METIDKFNKKLDEMKTSSKRGNAGIGLLISLAIGLVVAGVVMALGATVNTSLGTTLTGNPAAVVGNSTLGLLNMASQFPVIGTVGAIVVVLGLVIGGLAVYAGFGAGGGRK